MATKIAINALIKKYAETKGEVFTIMENLNEKRGDLQALETSMRLLGGDVCVNSIKPKHKRKFNAKLPVGTVPMLGGEYIRELVNGNDDFTTNDVIDYVLKIRKVNRNEPIAANIAISVLNYLRRQEKQGLITEIERVGRGQTIVWQKL